MAEREEENKLKEEIEKRLPEWYLILKEEYERRRRKANRDQSVKDSS